MANRHHFRARLPALIAAVCASSLSLSTALADDTEVFFGQVDPKLDIFPNVMFVLDTSGSMNFFDGGHSTRLERMKVALETILDNTTNVNVGVMRFNGSNGGGAVLYPITPIDQKICEQGNCGEQSAAPRLSTSDSDIEERVSDGNMSLGGDILGIGSSERGPERVGLRFKDIDIPQGATITSAKLEFTAHNTQTGPASFLVEGELSENADPFLGWDYDASSRITTAATETWIPGPWWQGLEYQSGDVSSILQEIVNQADWCGGNAAALMLTGVGTRYARSFDQSASDAPALKYTYDASSIPVGGGCTNKTVVSQISASTDDAEQRTRYGNTYTNSSDLEMPYDRGNEQIVGLRFNDIKIPKNAVITSASIEFEVDRQRTGNLALRVQGQAADNPVTFAPTWRNITNRAKTNASVTWNPVPQLSANAKMTVDGLESIPQELVNRNGWTSGNSMVFLISKASNNRRFRELESFDGEPTNAAKLRIQYHAVNTGNQPTVITARDKLKQVVSGLTATGGTPIVDAYYEAARYFRGETVDYGKRRGPSMGRYHRVSVPESYTGGYLARNPQCTDGDLDQEACRTEAILGNAVYQAPFKSSCQTNHIVFLSDGAATSNSAANKVRAMIGNNACSNTRWDETCGEELGAWLNDTDHSNALTGKQNISTYTIGFNFSSDFLKDIATAGGGAYFQADSSDQLVKVFQSILGDVLAIDTSFVAPGATVNQFNRLTHRNDIYFALFKPDQRPTWEGNLKRYEVGKDASGEINILDINRDPAVDETTGFFKDTSRSWWLNAGESNDGNMVAKGGAARQLEFSASPRRIFTYVGDNSAIPSPGSINLTQAAHALSEDNAAITNDHLGIANKGGTQAEIDAYRHDLLRWARGIDVRDDDEDNDTNDWRMHMGDPMHARPVILNYAAGSGTETTVFVGTNEGYLHAFERDGGTELFSYVPQELLPNFDTYWNNQSSDSHPYGLDGTLSVWTTDENENVTIDSGEEAFLYTGMRRGGSNYYALDVANRMNPKLAWVIEAGNPGFEELGQTWSKMVPTKIRFNGEERHVLVFAAGYDENQDWSLDATNNQLPRTVDTKGRGIYIVDARTGERLYAALGSNTGDIQLPGMDYSMPGDLRVLDTDYDGFADQIYASDTGGQLWRFDITQHHKASSGQLLQGGIMADLSGNGAKGERRFYYEPDVALISNNGDRFLSISIGSGWRAHPLDLGVDDRFYMIKSTNLFGAPAGYGKSTDGGQTFTPITEADLINVTNDLNPPTNDYGWMYDLGAKGEKVLGTSVTANNKVIFTSYRPALSVGACTTAIGGGSLYALDVINGGPSVDMNDDGELNEDDREKQLAHGGIPPEPAVLITDDGPIVLAGPERFDPGIENLTRRTFWVDKGDENQ